MIPRDDNVYYLGGDIVSSLIQKNMQQLKGAHTDFFQIDITRDALPEKDLWICRDCLLHFSDNDIFKAIRNFLNSRIPYLLTTTYTESPKNKNIPTGAHRFLNLELPPFNFCKPLFYIEDWIEGHPVKKLGLWEKDRLFKT